ncbi:DUF2382 domain-containing protein [Geodermatophilus sp. YIM 151500]|uniref:DUF2382 domain-containing protein n=1 Tax=Geodermatophilus sp. YIM 151500 TaxID=2984531 RepID=UPI0021E4D51A|nr:DUF2382 domain-containing protein [Geodermatophilus sp. YIM 151500]MCV2491217.1 DUF2382 domain-containing protein [Geodermatophilus sp. YIM 151500]
MLNDRELSAAVGSTAYDADGEKIGTVEHFFVDDVTGAPTWVAVSTGLFGTRHSVVPAAEAAFADGVLRLPVRKDAVKHAPHVDTDHLDAASESELRRHYGLGGPPPGTEGTGTGTEGTGAGTEGTGAGTEAAGPSTAPGAAPSGPGAAPTGSPGTATSGGPPTAADPAVRDATPGSGPPTPEDEGGGGRDRPWSPTETGVVPVGAVRGATDAEPPGPVAVTDAEVAAARRGDDGTPAGEPGAEGAAAQPDRTAGEEAGTAAARAGGMVRGEEQLRVRTESVPDRRVRLVKYVITEEVQVTVPLRREEFRLEEVPVGEDPAGGDVAGPAVTGESLAPGGPTGEAPGGGLPAEIVLHAERPVVGVEVVPVERVRLRIEQVTGEERVTERVQREQVVADES